MRIESFIIILRPNLLNIAIEPDFFQGDAILSLHPSSAGGRDWAVFFLLIKVPQIEPVTHHVYFQLTSWGILFYSVSAFSVFGL